MKNLSLVLNIILLTAVIVLFYLHFSGSKPQAADAGETGSSDSASVATAKKAKKEGSIFYVNIDSLNEHYEMLKDIAKQMQARKAGLESEYQSKVQRYQQMAQNYQQRIQADNISVEEARKVENDLMSQKANIESYEQKMNSLVEEVDKKNFEARKELSNYLEEYKKGKNIDYILGYSSVIQSIVYGNDSLDLTAEVLQGLNARYKEKNSTPKK